MSTTEDADWLAEAREFVVRRCDVGENIARPVYDPEAIRIIERLAAEVEALRRR